MKKIQQTIRIHYILYIVPILFVLPLIIKSNASAITYQNSINTEFTLNPTISLNLSSSNLIIEDLAPGSSSDSNIITVNVSTNAGWGYYLAATAGTSSTNTNLTHETNNTNIFTSLNSNKSTLLDFSDNTWGYSYCNNNGSIDCTNTTNWVSGNADNTTTGYNGLPLDGNNSGSTGIKLLNSNSFAGSGSIKFKIGAKAANTQAAGTYSGIVNFYAVTNKGPATFDDAFSSNGKHKYLGYYKMQDMTSGICQDVEQNQTTKVIDVRDNQVYTVAKLKDDNCWMTENLNLAGGTALSADTTDVTSTYINSFTTSNNLTKSGNTIVLPNSSTSGFDTNNYSYVYNSGNKTNCGASGQNTPCYSYYSWDAATLGSGRTISTDDTDAKQSICPKGWKLPASKTTSAANWQTTSDFYALAHQYGLDSNTTTNESDSDFYVQAGPSTTPNFLLAGVYNDNNSFLYGGDYGFYWGSSSFFDADNTRYLFFNSSYANTASYSDRAHGFSVRCLFRD